MRIISKTKDYYDSAQAYGQDRSTIYNRKESERTLASNDLAALEPIAHYQPRDTVGTVPGMYKCGTKLIGFCGMVYPVFYINERYFYTTAQIYKYLNVKKHKVMFKHWLTTYNRRWISSYFFNLQGVTDYIKEVKHRDTDLNLFINYDTPVWVLESIRREYKFTINPTLKKYDFARVVDPYSAYQEIAMFMESTLARERIPDPTNVPDEYLAAAKGFDSWSFKKQPTKMGRKAKKRI